jgi:hypothetical protein
VEKTVNRNALLLSAVICLCIFPATARSQCFDSSCQSLQNIYNSAQIDYRDYRAKNAPPAPSLSAGGLTVPCQLNLWANNVPMYICFSQAPLAGADAWFRSTLQGMKRVQPSWEFKIVSAGAEQSVDAGPLNCEPTPAQGPYSDQCPLHMQLTRQPDGSTRLYFILNSLSSPYLFPHPAAYHPPARAGMAARAPQCDDFCESFQKVFAARNDSFAAFRSAGVQAEDTQPSVRFDGAQQCAVQNASRPDGSTGVDFVCRWLENSGFAAGSRFQDIISRVRALLPGDWSPNQQTASDNVTGVPVKLWSATEPGGKHDVRIYLSGETVAMHVTAWK